MLIIGLTGGIGSGKSTVEKLFAELGAPTIDADLIARQLITENISIHERIKEYFGKEVIGSTGQINRKKLRQFVFQQTEKRLWLEKLLHPKIIIAIQQQIVLLNNKAYCLIVMPLLTEVEKAHSLVHRILLVDISEKLQIKRTIRRDHLTKIRATQIIKTQATRQQRYLIADDVLNNESNRASLKKAVMNLHKFYQHLSKNF